MAKRVANLPDAEDREDNKSQIGVKNCCIIKRDVYDLSRGSTHSFSAGSRKLPNSNYTCICLFFPRGAPSVEGSLPKTRTVAFVPVSPDKP